MFKARQYLFLCLTVRLICSACFHVLSSSPTVQKRHVRRSSCLQNVKHLSLRNRSIHTFPPYYSSLSFHCGPRLIFKISNYILKCVLTFNICRAIKWHLFVAFQAIGFLFGCCLVVVLVEVSQTYFILFTYHKPLFSSFVLIGYGDTWNNKKRRARPYFLTTESHHYSVMVKEPHCTQKSSHQLGVVFWFWIQQISHT